MGASPHLDDGLSSLPLLLRLGTGAQPIGPAHKLLAELEYLTRVMVSGAGRKVMGAASGTGDAHDHLLPPARRHAPPPPSPSLVAHGTFPVAGNSPAPYHCRCKSGPVARRVRS